MMNAHLKWPWQRCSILAAALWLTGFTTADDKLPQNVVWKPVANNHVIVPGTVDHPFNSYNQPSVNSAGCVVFRARARGLNPMSV
jgi:hypothetical protein